MVFVFRAHRVSSRIKGFRVLDVLWVESHVGCGWFR